MGKQKTQEPEAVVVYNDRKGTVTIPGVGMLMPGANVRTIVQIEEMEKKTTKQDGSSSIPPGTIRVEKRTAAGTLARDEKAAIALVAETFQVELLNGWLAEEKRQKVQKAIHDQIDALTKEPEGAEGAEGGKGDNEGA